MLYYAAILPKYEQYHFGGRKYFAKLVIPFYFLILWVKDPRCLKDKLKVEEGGTQVL